MSNRRAFIIYGILSVYLLVSCKAERRSPEQDTAAVVSQPAASPIPIALNPGWDLDKGGPAIVVASSDNQARAAAVLPLLTDSMLAHQPVAIHADSLIGMSLDLFDRSGSRGTARLISQESSAAEGCVSWPSVAVEGAQHSWLVGFRRGTVTSLPLDSLEGMTAADSLGTTTELARLASALPESNDPAFQGLPFAVRKAYRSVRDSILIGDIVRKINEEANPREEHLLIVAEHVQNNSGHYSTVFHTRAAGAEDVVRTSDLLSGVRFINGGNPAFFVSFEYEDGARLVLIERVNQSWKLSWRSAYAGC